MQNPQGSVEKYEQPSGLSEAAKMVAPHLSEFHKMAAMDPSIMPAANNIITGKATPEEEADFRIKFKELSQNFVNAAANDKDRQIRDRYVKRLAKNFAIEA